MRFKKFASERKSHKQSFHIASTQRTSTSRKTISNRSSKFKRHIILSGTNPKKNLRFNIPVPALGRYRRYSDCGYRTAAFPTYVSHEKRAGRGKLAFFLVGHKINK